MGILQYKLWDKKNKQWYDEDDVLLERDGTLTEYHYDCFENLDVIDRTNDFIIVPYTGMKDKRGKKIYKGDICKIVTYDGKPFGTVALVTFSNGSFKLLIDTEELLLSISIDDEDIVSIEVIGNVFENPELIGDHMSTVDYDE